MIVSIDAPGPIYLGKINSRSLINKFLLICEKERRGIPLVERVIMINPYINDFSLELLNKLASADISPVILANPRLDNNPLNAQARARYDIIKKIKQALPKNSFFYENKTSSEIKLPSGLIDINNWREQETLILLPYQTESFFILSSLMQFSLNGEINELELNSIGYNINDLIKLSKIYGKILRQKTLK